MAELDSMSRDNRLVKSQDGESIEVRGVIDNDQEFLDNDMTGFEGVPHFDDNASLDEMLQVKV